MYEALGNLYQDLADVYAEIGAGMSMNVQQAAADPELAGQPMNVAYYILTAMPVWKHYGEIISDWADIVAAIADALGSF